MNYAISKVTHRNFTSNLLLKKRQPVLTLETATLKGLILS